MSITKEELLEALKGLQSPELQELTVEEESSWHYSLVNLPRLSISSQGNNYLIPWHGISYIEANDAYTIFRLNCDYGLFVIKSATPLRELYKYLQVERVKSIIESGSLKISLIETEEKS